MQLIDAKLSDHQVRYVGVQDACSVTNHIHDISSPKIEKKSGKYFQ